MRLHDYAPPVTAAAMYAIATPEELAAASLRAQERLQGDEAVDPLAEAYQAVMEAAGRRMSRSLRSQAVALTADSRFIPPDEDEVLDSERLALEMADGAGEAWRDAARVVVAALDDEGISFDVDTVFTDELLAGIGARATTLTDEVLRKQYRFTLEVASEHGWSVADTADALVNKINELAPYQARALARTDLNGLANGGSVHVAQVALKGEAAYKRWLATDDERTRDTHVEADGQTVPVNDNFTVGFASLPYPGFPFGPAEEVINCRCTVTYTSDPSDADPIVRDPDAATRDPLRMVTPSDDLIDAATNMWERSDLVTEGVPDYMRKLEAKLTTELAETEVRIRTPADVALEVAEDGRFMSQFETQTSQGSLAPAWRAKAENALFSYPENLPAQERPIYGYLGGITEEPGAVRQYGNTVWRLKAAVRERTTWTGSDSLALEFAPSPVTRPSVLSADPFGGFEPLTTPLREWDTFYFEAQVHGGVTLDDVVEVALEYESILDLPYYEADAVRIRAALQARGYGEIPVIVRPSGNYQAAQIARDRAALDAGADGGLGLAHDGLEVEIVGGVDPVPTGDDAERRHLGPDEQTALVEHAHDRRLEPVAPAADEEHEVDLAALSDHLHTSDDTSTLGGSQPSESLRFTNLNEEAAMSTTEIAPEQLADSEIALTPIGWDAVLCQEGLATEDGRMLERNSIGWRDLPLTLMGMIETSGWGHEGAMASGRIDTINRVLDDLASTGELTTAFGVDTLAPMIADRTVRGVSVDLAVMDYEYRDRDTGAVLSEEDLFDYWMRGDEAKVLFVVLDGTIVGATVCPMPAIANAEISLAASAGLSSQGRAILASALEGRKEVLGDVQIMRFFTPFDRPAREGLFAAGAVVELADPPRSAFELTEFPGNTPFTVADPDETGWRRVFGHIATWDTCHVGIPGVCTTAPRSSTSPEYAYFHTSRVVTAEGDTLDVGNLMLGTGHADLTASRMEATRHYDRPDMVGARVRATDGEYGIWVSGVVRPELSAAGLRQLRENPPSGDWRSVGGLLELIAVCAVAVPGFPVIADAQANITAAGGMATISALIATAGHIVPTTVVRGAMIAAGCACEELDTLDEYVDDLAELGAE